MNPYGDYEKIRPVGDPIVSIVDMRRKRKTQKQIMAELYSAGYADGYKGYIIEAPEAIRHGWPKKLAAWTMGYKDGLGDGGYGEEPPLDIWDV